MHHFTIVACSSGPIGSEYHRATLRRIRASLPFSAHIQEEWATTSEDAMLLAYWATNESGTSIPKVRAEGDVVLISGESSDDQDMSALGPNDALHRQIGQMTGRFSAAVVDLRRSICAAATTLARLDPIYTGSGRDLHVVSTWSRTVAACLAHDDPLSYERAGLISFLNAGHFYSDTTFYHGVAAMPPYATTLLTPAGMRQRSDFYHHVLGDSEPDPSFYDRVTDALVSACRRLRGTGSPLVLNLSGGKDSRLLLAGLRAADVPVEAVTTSGGASNSADVYCAGEVARAAGVPHTIRDLRAQDASRLNRVPVDLYRRTTDILRATDAQIISWGNMAYEPRNSGRIILNGLGGELLRGGYGKTAADLQQDRTPFEFLISRAARQAAMMAEPILSEYRQYLEGWLGEFPRALSTEEAADFGYLYFRMGRWASAQSRAGVLARRPTYPLLDNAFLSLVYSVPTPTRLDDRLLHHVLDALNPQLADLPFANDAWRFQDGSEVDLLRRSHPAAFVPRGQGSAPNTDWRQNWTFLLPELRRQILTERSWTALSEIVVPEAVADLLEGVRIGHGHRFLLFSLYAASIVLSDGLSFEDRTGQIVEVPLSRN